MTSSIVIARSQRVRPEVAGPMTGSATKQSSFLRKRPWIASLPLARTQQKSFSRHGHVPELCQSQQK
jgi:hypothetical protein